MFREERKKFINQFKHSPKIQEEFFYTDKYKNENVICSKKIYNQYCDETTMITNIDSFFDSGWYDNYNNTIDNISNYSEVKDLIIEFKRFKLILKIQDDNINELETNLLKCIIKRIQYKYKCILESERNIGHDVEYLKQIYHYNRMKELKYLFKRILDKRIELKEDEMKRQKDEMKRQKDEMKRQKEFLEDDIEIDKNLSNTSSSDSFTPVVKNKKNSRKKH